MAPFKVTADKWRLSGLLRGDHRLILRDLSIISGFILLAKLAAALKEMVVASKFGIGSVVDAYLFVFNLIGVPLAVWYSIIYAVLVPLIIKVRSSNEEKELRFRRELLGATIILGLFGGLFMWILLRGLLSYSNLGLPNETHALATQAADLLVFLIPLGFVIHLGSVFLMTRSWHANSLLEGVPALVIMLTLLLGANGIEVLVLATLAGFAAQLLLTVICQHHKKVFERPAWQFTSIEWASFGSGVVMVLAAQVMLALTTVIDQFFAAGLGSGSISSLGYATRILTLFLALGATALGRATLPVYSHVMTRDPGRLPRLAVQWAMLLAAIGAAIMIFGWFFSEWMVRLLFERDAFSSADTARVTEVLRWGFLQVPFYFAMVAASQALLSARRYGTSALLAALCLATKLSLSMVLVNPLGLSGLMISTAAMYAVSCIVLLYILGAGARR